MKTRKENGLTIITADEGKLLRKENWEKTQGVEEIYLCKADSADNYIELPIEEFMEPILEEPQEVETIEEIQKDLDKEQ